MNNGYDFNAHHDSHCEGPYCNCDNRNYGNSFDCSGVVAAICVILAILVSLISRRLDLSFSGDECSVQSRTGQIAIIRHVIVCYYYLKIYKYINKPKRR